MIPHQWLHAISVVSLALGFLCAAWIAVDEFRRPQHMWIMNLVWPLTALFGGLLALAGYLAYGRGSKGGHGRHGMMHDEAEMPGGKPAPFAVAVGKGTTHCGSGCALGDICAEWLVFAFPGIAVWFGWKTIFAEQIFAAWVLDFIAAFLFGIAFQYFTIKPMRGLTPMEGLIAALKADALSLCAWQIGMYGFMAVAHFWIFGSILGASLDVASAEFWFMMQIAMLCGFITAYPVNWWLISVGIKEEM